MLNRLDMLRIFCAAAEARNFKEAATRLGISPQAVTRAVQQLESHLGEVLFHRNTRRTHISEFGEQLAARAKISLDSVAEIFQRSPQIQDTEMSGLVRITASQALGKDYLIPMLGELQAQHPELRLDLRLSDRSADVVDEQIDIGVRVGFMRDSRYIARAVAQVPFYIVGSPALIARVGAPKSVKELSEKPAIVAIDPNNGKPWPWYFRQGQQWSPRTPVFATDDTRAECDATLAGMGFGQLTGFVAVPHLRNGRLVQVLSDFAPEPWNLYVYRPQRGPTPARIRLVFDWLVDSFSDTERFPLAVY